jgi:hypothetical protein
MPVQSYQPTPDWYAQAYYQHQAALAAYHNGLYNAAYAWPAPTTMSGYQAAVNPAYAWAPYYYWHTYPQAAWPGYWTPNALYPASAYQAPAQPGWTQFSSYYPRQY